MKYGIGTFGRIISLNYYYFDSCVRQQRSIILFINDVLVNSSIQIVSENHEGSIDDSAKKKEKKRMREREREKEDDRGERPWAFDDCITTMSINARRRRRETIRNSSRFLLDVRFSNKSPRRGHGRRG